jgi:hypothetical protein
MDFDRYGLFFVGFGCFVGLGSLVGFGSLVGLGSFVGSAGLVGFAGGSEDAGGGFVGNTEPEDCDGSLFLADLTGVRMTGAKGVGRLCKRSQGCKATGNSRQFELSEQIFKLKDIDCGPRQITMRLPLTTSAVRQVTVADCSTSKEAEAGKISMACVSSPTQN